MSDLQEGLDSYLHFLIYFTVRIFFQELMNVVKKEELGLVNDFMVLGRILRDEL